MRTMSASNVKTKTTISWNDQARKLKQKFATLTDQDLYFEQGKMGGNDRKTSGKSRKKQT
jgi:hypothetical protein